MAEITWQRDYTYPEAFRTAANIYELKQRHQDVVYAITQNSVLEASFLDAFGSWSLSTDALEPILGWVPQKPSKIFVWVSDLGAHLGSIFKFC